jgi:hypothetical protein
MLPQITYFYISENFKNNNQPEMRSTLFLKIATALSVSFSASVGIAQNVDRETATFEYIKLPSKPLGKDLKGYNAKVIQNDIAKNKEMKAVYDKQVRQAENDYKKKLKETDDKEKARVAEANKTKVTAVLNAMQKKESLPVPEKEEVDVPIYYKEVNEDASASQFINLKGFKKGADDIQILATLVGFENNSPNFTVNQANKASYTFTYKNPVSLLVKVGGEVVTDIIVGNTGNESTYTSSTFVDKAEAEKNWNDNKKTILEKLQTQSATTNLQKIDFVLNDLHGISKTKREADIYTVKNKKGDYNDVVEAYTELNEGLLSLGEDLLIEEGKTKIKSACEKFENILKEANITDKKARINQDVSTAILFNLVEANIWLNEYIKSQKYALKLKSNNINGREERRLEELRDFMKDHKQRFDINQ